jgi:HK97 family phage major capsid protein
MTDLSTLHETKALHADAATAFSEFARTFEAFKTANDERLSALEQRRGDVLTEEKLARIDRALDETQRRIDRLGTKAQRPHLGASETVERDAAGIEHKAAFDLYMRAGEYSGLKALESKALSAGSGPDGGYLVPPPVEREILRRMSMASPIRALASVREISTASFKKAYSTTGPGAGWIGEAAARPQTSSQVIADMNFPTMELYAMPAATQTLLDDAAVDVEQWVADEVQVVFAEQEGAAFVNGDGVTRPLGFMTPAKVAQSTWIWGKLGYVVSGLSGGFNATAGSDALIDLIYALKAGYRQNATFVMNRKTQSAIRKLKATTGEYLWQPPCAVGQPATLMNFPLVEAEGMPDIAADACAVAFGDFRRAYLIVDRIGIRVLRDPYSTKPYVLFYTTKRVGGGVQDFDALKLLKFGTA